MLETLKAQYEEQVASLREELEHERSTSGRQPPLEASGGITDTVSTEDKKDETDSHADDKSQFLKLLEQTSELQEQLRCQALQEQMLSGELVALRAHCEEERQREVEGLQEEIEGLQREVEGLRFYFEAELDARETELKSQLTETRFMYECETAALRQQLTDQGPIDLQVGDQSGGPMSHEIVDQSGRPMDHCVGDQSGGPSDLHAVIGVAVETDQVTSGTVSKKVQQITTTGETDWPVVGDVTRETDHSSINGTQRGSGDSIDVVNGTEKNIDDIVDMDDSLNGDIVDIDDNVKRMQKPVDVINVDDSVDRMLKGTGDDADTDNSVNGIQRRTGDIVNTGDSVNRTDVQNDDTAGIDDSVNRTEMGTGDTVNVDNSISRTERGTGDTFDVDDMSEMDISSEFGSQSLSHMTRHSSDVDSDTFDHSDSVMRELHAEIRGYQEQMEHFREISQRQHLAAVNQLRMELSEKKHKTEQELELNEEMENWKNTTHSRGYDTLSGDKGQRPHSDAELIHTESGSNIESVMLRELQGDFDSRIRLIEEQHLVTLDEQQKELDGLRAARGEMDRHQGDTQEKTTLHLTTEPDDNQLVSGDKLDRGKLKEVTVLRDDTKLVSVDRKDGDLIEEMTALTEECWKLKANLVECSAQIKECSHKVDRPGDKVTQEWDLFDDAVSALVTEFDDTQEYVSAEVSSKGDDSESTGTASVVDTSLFCDSGADVGDIVPHVGACSDMSQLCDSGSGSGVDTKQTKLSTCRLRSVRDVTRVVLDCTREVDTMRQSVTEQQGELKRLNEEKEEWSARMEDMRRSLTEEHDKHIQEVLEETKDAFEEEHGLTLAVNPSWVVIVRSTLRAGSSTVTDRWN
ncbi:hypothetical protein NP493_1190g00034 [Ridgeia piscesae]|uniref:Uncharacterized protein n=1 Tax=Ridgeia piscesae TaxID=27915 RepID=A0AAD9KDT9_RIDPI|nr:hypothetical protein NP493_1190g00034 [Ridgeia piscesae]